MVLPGTSNAHPLQLTSQTIAIKYVRDHTICIILLVATARTTYLCYCHSKYGVRFPSFLAIGLYASEPDLVILSPAEMEINREVRLCSLNSDIAPIRALHVI